MNPSNDSESRALSQYNSGNLTRDKHPMTGCCWILLSGVLGASMGAVAGASGRTIYPEYPGDILEATQRGAGGGWILGILMIVISRIISSKASDCAGTHHACEEDNTSSLICLDGDGALDLISFMCKYLIFSTASGFLGFAIFNLVEKSSTTFVVATLGSAWGGLITAPFVAMVRIVCCARRSLNDEIRRSLDPSLIEPFAVQETRDIEEGVVDSEVLPVSGTPGFLSAMKATMHPILRLAIGQGVVEDDVSATRSPSPLPGG